MRLDFHTTALALIAASCSAPGDPGLGSAGSDGTATGATGSSAASGDSSGSSAASTPSPETATSSPTGSDGASASGLGCPGGCTEFPLDCKAADCGGLGPYDSEGCLRENCTSDPEICGDGELCYFDIAFGGCASGGWSCFDNFEEMACYCGGSGDCGGGYCVPASLHPDGLPGPAGRAVVDVACGANGLATVELRVGNQVDGCEQVVGDSVVIDLDAVTYGMPATYVFGSMTAAGDGRLETSKETTDARFGFVRIETWGDAVTGHYYIWLDGNTNYSGAFDTLQCAPVESGCE